MENQISVFISLSIISLKSVKVRSKRKTVKKPYKKSPRKKNKFFIKPGKIIKCLIQLFFVFVIHSMANNGYMPKLPNPECPVLQYGESEFRGN